MPDEEADGAHRHRVAIQDARDQQIGTDFADSRHRDLQQDRRQQCDSRAQPQQQRHIDDTGGRTSRETGHPDSEDAFVVWS